MGRRHACCVACSQFVGGVKGADTTCELWRSKTGCGGHNLSPQHTGRQSTGEISDNNKNFHRNDRSLCEHRSLTSSPQTPPLRLYSARGREIAPRSIRVGGRPRCCTRTQPAACSASCLLLLWWLIQNCSWKTNSRQCSWQRGRRSPRSILGRSTTLSISTPACGASPLGNGPATVAKAPAMAGGYNETAMKPS